MAKLKAKNTVREISFNSNDYIKVKLSKSGEALLRLHKHTLVPDSNGYHELQLWEFMQIFGPTIVFGSTPMFDTNIIICLP